MRTGSEKKIMVVDDDPYIRVVVRELFEPEGFEVISAESGRECLEILGGRDFRGVILMDIMMPDMDGWDTIREIIRLGYAKGSVIAMLTAVEEPGELEDWRNITEYVIDYITKPFEGEEILKNVSDLMDLVPENVDV